MNLAANWRKARLRAMGSAAYFKLTPALYSLYRAFLAHAAPRVHGRVLDAGSGYGAWTGALRRAGASTVVAVDREAEGGSGVVADLKRLPFRDAAFDTIFCAQVLEHDAEPAALLAELGRVLKPGGYFILSAPHLSRIHDAPHDYFRYTEYGLRALAGRAGLAVEGVIPCGGAFSFIIHNVNTLKLAAMEPLPLARALTAAWAKLTTPAWAALDRAFDRRGLFPLNYLMIGRKDGR